MTPSSSVTPHDSLPHTALIVGGTSERAYELATRLARNGHDLVYATRSHYELYRVAEWLARTYQIRARVIACGVGDAQAAQALVAHLRTRQVRIDCLVNDVVAPTGPADAVALQEYLAGVLALSGMLLQDMVAGGSGRVLHLLPAERPEASAVEQELASVVGRYARRAARELRGTGVTMHLVRGGDALPELGPRMARRLFAGDPRAPGSRIPI